MTFETDSDWELIKHGQYELAYSRLTNKIQSDPNAFYHLHNRAPCLMLMNRKEDALIDFYRFIQLRPESDSGYIMAGVVLWCLDRQYEAVEIWQESLHPKYTDPAGGIQVPALLYLAAIRLADLGIEKEAVKMLQEKWHQHSDLMWPAHIAGFLIEQIDLRQLLDSASRSDALKSRRLCKAHFWISMLYFKRSDLEKYESHLRNALFFESIIEPEHFLAQHELKKLK